MDSRPVLTGHKGFRVVGLETRTSNAEEAGGAGRIGALWSAVHNGPLKETVPGTLDAPVLVAVYSDYVDGAEGEYRLVVGRPALDPGTPSELVSVEVPDGSFLLFEASGEMPQALIETWTRIHEYFAGPSPYHRTFAGDFELHDGNQPDHVAVYVAVR